MSAKQETINELTAIFPQHKNATIKYICDDVIENVGVENYVLVLPSCIERLLELPDDFVLPNAFRDPQDNQFYPGLASNVPNGTGYENKVLPNSKGDKSLLQDQIVNLDKIIPLRRESSLLDSEDEKAPDPDGDTSSEEIAKDLETYRNRKVPTYREPIKDASDSSSNSLGAELFPDDDELFTSQEVTVLEEQSTKAELVKHPVYDKDDILFIGASGSKNTGCLSTPILNENRKRKQEYSYSEPPPSKKPLNSKQSFCEEKNNLSGVFTFLDNVDKPETKIKIQDKESNSAASNRAEKSNTLFSKSPKVNNSTVGHSEECLPAENNKTPHPNKIKTSSSSTSLPSCNSQTPTSSTFTVAKPEQKDFSMLTRDMPGYFENARNQIKSIIEDVDIKYLEKLIKDQPGTLNLTELVNSLVVYLLDFKDYTKAEKLRPSPGQSGQSSSSYSWDYRHQVVMVLQNNFPQVSTKVIRNMLANNKNCYKASFCKLDSALKKIQSGEAKVGQTVIGSFMKGRRKSIVLPSELDTQLQQDIESLKKEKHSEVEKDNYKAAVALNMEQYEEEGQAIECGCCYGDAAFEDMIQCLEGHLFCVDCLQRYSKEATFGEGNIHLSCMTDGCDSTFPFSQMKKALPESIMQRYYERVKDEDLKLANIDNLVRCPGCEFAAEMADGDKVFRCQNPSCLKETCRYCQEEWNEHFGLPCKEVEKKTVKNLRTTYEEKMTEAKVRACWQCKTIFLKSSGCNKMTCRCGAKMCYICRQAKIDYGHFCQHFREPGHGCTKCTKCSLWTDPTEDDDRAVAEIQKEAEEERKRLDVDVSGLSAPIGPKIEAKEKKQNKDNKPPGEAENGVENRRLQEEQERVLQLHEQQRRHAYQLVQLNIQRQRQARRINWERERAERRRQQQQQERAERLPQINERVRQPRERMHNQPQYPELQHDQPQNPDRMERRQPQWAQLLQQELEGMAQQQREWAEHRAGFP
ncbi:uncharacterized protein LOC130648798 [Hydractinia symbiolongicarpus]|uniref:uncharacterized protein LOC130648798 n=1 Tax=Hydractinia symbiolongicarpus TaxID=13093 RepID=UPI00255012F7|nr:uncharacterized protein LOC130648798 [Hydractinia symbiolongicarpus]XP_057310879.1 uncharacterized protein LOC130648798 [Hydractinia symbiolongicarpus]XP_057310880.1 uncharacterized protein LOC130648798 [Hydractinia symbiolongicarpus]XP_057310881.1 uncharacterized protein LOC130648798 [Hydractinia symbiolongicarpus]